MSADDTVIDTNPFEGVEVISSHSRAQAIEDGQLVDVSEIAREAGLRWPTVVTAAVWTMIEDIPGGLAGIADAQGRLWDVLWMARSAAHSVPADKDLVPYKLRLPTKSSRKSMVTLWLQVGPGDDARPVLTIGLPEDW